MKRVIFLITASVILTSHLTAQTPNSDFSNRMNRIFQLADKSKVATGLLSDYGLQMVDPKYFNGLPADSNYVDMDTWRLLYSVWIKKNKKNNIFILLLKKH
jgi:hypothetical protein